MTKQEYENKLQELQNQIEELKKVKIEEENKIWKPKNGEKYYLVFADGTVYNKEWDNAAYANGVFELGGCFQTKEQAEFEKEKRIIKTKFKRYLKEHSDKISIDNIEWYNLEFDIVYGTISAKKHSAVITNDYIASSEEILNDAVKFIGGEEVAKKYLFDYIGE